MGFLEDLRRKSQEALLKPKVVKEPWIWIKPEQAWKLEKARRVEKLARAHQAYADSGLQELIVEMGKLGAYKNVGEVPVPYESPEQSKIWTWQGFGEMPRETYLQSMTISFDKKYGMTIEKSIKIEVDAEGTVFFRGGFFGSSEIFRFQWEKDKSVLERSLGKAYKHPKTKRWGETSSDSSSFEPRGFGW